MRYIPNTDADCRAMLQAIGVRSVEELFGDIPPAVRLKRPLKVPPAMSESEVGRHLRALAAQNADADRYSMFLGAGCYHHFSPTIINHLVLRGEFLTPYTPYQAEVSQGTLQALFEYQTLVCLLTGMEVSNASMYEGASATAEAVLMAQRVTGRSEVVVARAVHPRRMEELSVKEAALWLRERAAPGGTVYANTLKVGPYLGRRTRLFPERPEDVSRLELGPDDALFIIEREGGKGDHEQASKAWILA